MYKVYVWFKIGLDDQEQPRNHQDTGLPWWVLHQHGLRSHCPRENLLLHTDKEKAFWGKFLWSDKTWTDRVVGPQWWEFQRNTLPTVKHHALGLFCCQWNCCAAQSGWNDERCSNFFSITAKHQPNSSNIHVHLCKPLTAAVPTTFQCSQGARLVIIHT